MSRTEKPDLVAEKLERQQRPPAIGTLKRVECELDNMIEHSDLNEEWLDIMTDLRKQVNQAIG